MTPPRDEEPGSVLERVDRQAHVAVDIFAAGVGSAAGAAAGLLAGPVGVVTGAILGGLAGGLLAHHSDVELHERADHDRELDAIGPESEFFAR